MNSFLEKIKRYRSSNNVNIEELYSIIKSNEKTILLDVRSPQEYNEGHLNGSINIPLYELEQCCNCKLKQKEDTIIVYCQSGIRSKKAINILKNAGFKNLYHLKGGLDEI